MSGGIDWNRRAVNGGVAERSFRMGDVPGILWQPARGEPAGLVLVGHGGSGHKRNDRTLSHARWFATSAGLAALALDGPYHGDRAVGDYQERIAAEGAEKVMDRVVGEWLDVLEAVGPFPRLGYLGMSMGGRYGVALAAALGDRLDSAVLGKVGLRQGPGLHPGLATPDRMERDARAVRAPTLFHIQWDDELFPKGGQLELFYVLGAADKRLIGYPGPHEGTPPAAMAEWRAFTAHHLTGRGRPGSR